MSQFTLIQKRAMASLAAALFVHVAVIGAWVMIVFWDLPLFAYEAPKPELDPEPEVTFVLHRVDPLAVPPPLLPPPPAPEPAPVEIAQQKPQQPNAAKPPQPKSPTPPAQPAKPAPPTPKAALKPPKEQKRRFARTSEDQAGKPTEPTDVLGERDTAAASELPADPSAKPNTPSQNGDAPLFPGHVETVESKHKDGSVGSDKTGAETEMPQPASARKDSPDIDDTPKVKTPTPEEGSQAKPNTQHLKQGTPMPASDNNQGKKLIQDDKKNEQAPKEKPNKGSKTDGNGEETEQKPKKDGFKGHSRKTKITGSINRRGKSSLNVKNSPLGRYQALVSKAVELQWRRNCEQHRDHIVPGVVSVRFYVDKKGNVSGVKFQEVIGANLIETGFTQRAIRQAKLPKMPKAVMKELRGEPLELILNFYFQ